MKIFLIRHANPDWHRKDIPYDIVPGPLLTAKGEGGAGAGGISEDLVKLYSSPFAGAARVIVSQGDDVRQRGGVGRPSRPCEAPTEYSEVGSPKSDPAKSGGAGERIYPYPCRGPSAGCYARGRGIKCDHGNSKLC
jgi:hypothetical protein